MGFLIKYHVAQYLVFHEINTPKVPAMTLRFESLIVLLHLTREMDYNNIGDPR